MIVSDNTIQKLQLRAAQKYDPFPLIEPFHLSRLQPASYDLTLANEFLHLATRGTVDTIIPGTDAGYVRTVTDKVRVEPDDFLLASTVEKVFIPNDMIARVEGKSSLGRIGLMVHVTAGFIDPGFRGNITLEIKNVGPWAIMLSAGMSIAQIAFQFMDRPADRPYGDPALNSRYQDSKGVIGAKATS